MVTTRQTLTGLLARHRPRTEEERADVAQVLALAEGTDDPWARSEPVHITASALIVHPDSGRVLLRWHPRHESWLLVGGHADDGENDPLAIALREGREETGLTDLSPWPDTGVRHVAIVPVPANTREPAHHHADLRFVLATRDPDAARPESSDAPLRWMEPAEALEAVAEANVRDTLSRVTQLLV
ncbi:NUDIX hydrolase [Streptomyces lushanensis]|uniref:NUDIX hydrolase n=1 Tax=Streptomyces lushanensis TaxID=1434255 RepID=UPI00082F509C|nr:NUDIX domain-containing protein [Streptomyces lushanensis]